MKTEQVHSTYQLSAQPANRPLERKEARLAGSEVKNAKFHAERHNEAKACGTVATCLACGITATHLACGTPILATVFCSFQAAASVPLQERRPSYPGANRKEQCRRIRKCV